jgi:hypothetical protein
MQALLVAGTAAYGAYAANESGKAQQDLATRNARLLEQSAASEIEAGNEEANALRMRTRKLIGAQKAALAGQGVNVGSEVAGDLRDDALGMSMMDEQRIRKNAFRSAWNINTQASNQRLSGQYARRAGQNQAIGTVLGGIGDASMYYKPSAPRAGKTPAKAPASANWGPSGQQVGGGYYGPLFGG